MCVHVCVRVSHNTCVCACVVYVCVCVVCVRVCVCVLVFVDTLNELEKKRTVIELLCGHIIETSALDNIVSQSVCACVCV